MTRVVVSVATTERSQRGQQRLMGSGFLPQYGLHFSELPVGCPPHRDAPYAFKAYALRCASARWSSLLWCDASVVPIRSMEPLWERIERDGYWMSDQAMLGTAGYTNYEWTADSSYVDLFNFSDLKKHMAEHPEDCSVDPATIRRRLNRRIPHVIAGCFGLSMRHEKGRAFLDEYFRLASETRAFCGPWVNGNFGTTEHDPPNGFELLPGELANMYCYPCGPADVRGHRHDQTAASVIAWRLGFELTRPPAWIAYKGHETEETIMLVDGTYA